MDRRQPGHLLPAGRCIEHVFTLAMRNVVPTAAQLLARTGPPCLFFQILSEVGFVLYRSETIDSTCNPTWAPMEWSFMADAAETDIVEFGVSPHLAPGASKRKTRAHAMRFQLYCAPEPDRWTDSAARSSGQYFLEEDLSAVEAAAGLRDCVMLLDRRIDLRSDLHFLGFDVFDALAQLDPASASSSSASAVISPLPGSGVDASGVFLSPLGEGSALAASPASSASGFGGALSAGAASAFFAAAAAAAAARDYVIVDVQSGGNLPPSAYALDAAPANMLLLALDDGHYLLRDTALVLLGLKLPAQLQPSSSPTDGSSASGTAGTGSLSIGIGPAPAAVVAASAAGAGSSGASMSSSTSSAAGGGSRAGIVALNASSMGIAASSASAAASAAAMTPPAIPTGPCAPHDLRLALEGTHALLHLRAESADAEAARAERGRQAAAAICDADDASASIGALDVVARALKLQRLRAARDGLAADVSAEGRALEARRRGIAAEAAGILRAVRLQQQSAALIAAMQAEVEAVRGEVGLLRTLLTAKQLSLLAELRSLYPIEEVLLERGGRAYAIRGLHLPSRDLHALPVSSIALMAVFDCWDGRGL